MDNAQYLFLECGNPECGLRFPGYSGIPKWNRCPVCRSTVNVVSTIIKNEEKNNIVNISDGFHVAGLLDNIRSAWNVGSIFRTADGTGIGTLYLCGITPSPENPRVRKTALGTENNITWEISKNGVKTAERLKSQGHIVWALEGTSESEPLFQVDFEGTNLPVILVVGNEVCGVDPGILELCDKVISIPMLGNKRSYNVAIAFSIATSFFLYRHNASHGSRNILPST